MSHPNRPTEETLKSLSLGDAVAVRVGSNARFQSFTVSFVSENFVVLTGPRGGSKTLVPSTCGQAVQLTDHHGKREWVSELETR